MPDSVEVLKVTLADRYPFERELGHGGMATVYLARDVKHHRRVAIKVLRPELGAMLGAERFLREIEMAANLSHPHILPLYDSGEADGLLYYVMPYVEGESLRDRLEREQQLPLEDALRLTQQVASALDYAHRHSIVHRDIKPENILLQEGHALVADFGIALAVRAAGGERLTGTGVSLGTPYYMSPEQATGERVIDARSDVYSLGCVLYEMLAGEPPFTGPTAQAVISRILTEQPRDLRSVRTNVSVALDRVIARSLSRLPADRFASAARFAEALASAQEATSPATVHFATHDGLSVGSDGVASPRPRWSRSRRVAPWLVAGVSMLLAAGLWLRPRAAGASLPPGEISTEEFRTIVAADQDLVLDTRPHLEFSIGHVPGARNVAARPGVPMSIYISDVAEVDRLVGGDMKRTIVLYCNGPFCPKSKRLADELSTAGHTRILRYQLGIPVWRAFGGVSVIEADGLRYVLPADRTAAVIDVREPDEFRGGTLPGARNIPRSLVLDGRDVGEIRKAKDDGRLPMKDHNTRVIVVGHTGGEARTVAQSLAHEAFHNVAYFPGTFEEARAALAH